MKKMICSDFFKNYINVCDLKPIRKGLFSFVKYETLLKEDKYVSSLCLYDTTKKEIVKTILQEDGACINQPLDEDHLLISVIRDDADKETYDKGIPITVLYKYNILNDTYTELLRLNKSIYKLEVISESKFLILCYDNILEDDYLKEAQDDWDKFLKIKERESRYFVADEVPFWINDGGYSNKYRGRVFLFDNGNIQQLTDNNLNIYDIKSYEDQYGIFYGVKSGGFQKTEGQLYKIDYKTSEISAIDDSNKYIYTKIQCVDSNHILVFRSDRSLHGEYQNEFIDIISLDDGSFTRNNKNADIHLYDNILQDISYLTGWLNKITVLDNHLIFIATKGISSKLYRMDIGNDNMTELTLNEGKILDYFIEDNKIYMSAMRGLGGPEFYCFDLITKEETQLSHFNDHLEKEYQFAEISSCNFINSTGEEIQGFSMKPIDYTEGKVYPTVLFIHGGPQSVYGDVFTHEMQLMASKGYGVIYCNPHGSEGRGGDFCDIRQKWGTIDYTDIMEFVDAAIAQNPWIDTTRLGITGGSYGGIMTNWIISHTDKFKAAISDRSVSNLMSDFFMSDIGFSCNCDTYGTTPWDSPELLWEHSAIKHAKNIKTPVLFIHGVDDYRCTYDNALQLHVAIQYHGGISKVFAFKNETHELCRSGSPINRQRRLDEMLNWFNKYLA